MVFDIEFTLEFSMDFVSGFVELGLIPYEEFPSSQVKFRFNPTSGGGNPSLIPLPGEI